MWGVCTEWAITWEGCKIINYVYTVYKKLCCEPIVKLNGL